MQPVIPAGSGRGTGVRFPPDEVRTHLARVLTSSAFRSSKRCARFLEFIVRESLDGRSATLKERTIATEVFDRSPAWDSSDDTIVRVGAREVRKRLAQYYSSPECLQDRIRIELPLGSYAPDFVHIESVQPATAVTVSSQPATVSLAPHPHPEMRSADWHSVVPGGRGMRWALLALVGVAALACWRIYVVQNQTAFDTFWAPFLRSSEPVVVAVAHPLVYRPSTRAYQLNSKRFGPPAPGTELPLKLPPDALNGSDFVPVMDQYLAFGDASAATSIQLLMAAHHRETHVRFGSKVEFADLRDGPSVIIGAFSNRWGFELSRRFRFHFGFDTHWVPAILDSTNAEKSWNIAQEKPDYTSPEDYFLICRVMNSPSGMPVIISAGVAQFGTEAAGRFITDPKLMSDVLRSMRKDWPSRNLEFVMHARVIGNSPAAPDLVASYVW